jgi:HAD superfamily hydrolase (TIGR01490 family)
MKEQKRKGCALNKSVGKSKSLKKKSLSTTNNAARSLALFDLDHTLFSVNVSFRFGIYLYRKKFLNFPLMLFLLTCYFFHKIGLMSVSSLNKKAADTFFRGKSLAVLDKEVCRFLEAEWEKMLNLPIVDCLQAAKSRGDCVAILSSSPDFIVRRVAMRFGVETWVATKYEVLGDDTLGNIERLVSGIDKALHAKSLMNEMGITKERVTAYTDSYLDLPFLEAAGNPVVVNPDRILRKICHRRGWVEVMNARKI